MVKQKIKMIKLSYTSENHSDFVLDHNGKSATGYLYYCQGHTLWLTIFKICFIPIDHYLWIISCARSQHNAGHGMSIERERRREERGHFNLIHHVWPVAVIFFFLIEKASLDVSMF